jgi:hypothetical protein
MKIFKILFAVSIIAFISNNLSAQEITSFPGMWGEEFYQDKEKLSWKEINKIMTESQVAQVQWQKSKKQALGGLLFGTVNFGSTIWLVSNLDDNKPLTGPIIAAAGSGLVGAIFFKMATKNKKEAILNYNDSLGAGTSFRLVPTTNENGVGLALKF